MTATARGSKLVLWRHPVLGMVADFGGRAREWGLTEARALEIVREWVSRQPPARRAATRKTEVGKTTGEA